MLRLLASHRHAAARFTAPSKNSAEFLSNLRLDPYTTTKKGTIRVPFLVVDERLKNPHRFIRELQKFIYNFNHSSLARKAA